MIVDSDSIPDFESKIMKLINEGWQPYKHFFFNKQPSISNTLSLVQPMVKYSREIDDIGIGLLEGERKMISDAFQAGEHSMFMKTEGKIQKYKNSEEYLKSLEL